MNGRQGDCIGLGSSPVETPPSFGCFVSRMLPSRLHGKVEMQPLLWQATQHLKAIVAYLKASPQEKTYSNYLQAAREAEKEDSMELSQNPQKPNH